MIKTILQLRDNAYRKDKHGGRAAAKVRNVSKSLFLSLLLVTEKNPNL